MDGASAGGEPALLAGPGAPGLRALQVCRPPGAISGLLRCSSSRPRGHHATGGQHNESDGRTRSSPRACAPRVPIQGLRGGGESRGGSFMCPHNSQRGWAGDCVILGFARTFSPSPHAAGPPQPSCRSVRNNRRKGGPHLWSGARRTSLTPAGSPALRSRSRRRPRCGIPTIIGNRTVPLHSLVDGINGLGGTADVLATGQAITSREVRWQASSTREEA